jgi:ubiquinone/menaquinone biosynthesis C-methylase UbiE
MSLSILYLLLGLPLAVLLLYTLVRIVRYFYKFPMPEFLADAIDNPLRRRIQPPQEMPRRHGIEPGMTVLEVGPGNGRYTVEAARAVGPSGRVIAIDSQPKMIERVSRRARDEGVTNLEAKTASVYDLPFRDATFDAVSMIAVISEIPDPGRALGEFHRVLKPAGTLAFSELITDPDYPLARTLIRLASSARFRLRSRSGNFLAYTLVFQKALEDAA